MQSRENESCFHYLCLQPCISPQKSRSSFELVHSNEIPAVLFSRALGSQNICVYYLHNSMLCYTSRNICCKIAEQNNIKRVEICRVMIFFSGWLQPVQILYGVTLSRVLVGSKVHFLLKGVFSTTSPQLGGIRAIFQLTRTFSLDQSCQLANN